MDCSDDGETRKTMMVRRCVADGNDGRLPLRRRVDGNDGLGGALACSCGGRRCAGRRPPSPALMVGGDLPRQLSWWAATLTADGEDGGRPLLCGAVGDDVRRCAPSAGAGRRPGLVDLYGDCGDSVSATGGVARREDCHGGGGPLLLESGRRCTPCGGAGRRPRLHPVRRSWVAPPAAGQRTLLLGAGLRPAELGGAPCFRAARWRGGSPAGELRGRRRGGQRPVRRRRPRMRLRPAELVGALPWTALVVVSALP
jgi:hypothetical protein